VNTIEAIGYYLSQTFEMWQEKLALGTVSAGVLLFFNLDKVLVIGLFWLMIADLAIGLFQAFKLKTYSPKILKRGIIKYPLFCAYILLVGIMDVAFERALGIMLPILDIFMAYMIFNEAGSILRHLEALGCKIPPLLKVLIHGGINRMEKEVKEKIGVESHEPKN
jgi:toxin secretion/phage lysis holin